MIGATAPGSMLRASSAPRAPARIRWSSDCLSVPPAGGRRVGPVWVSGNAGCLPGGCALKRSAVGVTQAAPAAPRLWPGGAGGCWVRVC